MNSERLIDIIEDAGYEPRSYSGRGMCGKQCVGLSTDDDIFTVALITACEDTDEAAALTRRTKRDSMGRGIVIYWPRAEWAADGDDTP